MDHRLLEVLACPICQGKLILSDNHQGLICRFDKLFYPINDGIPVLLEDEAVALDESHQRGV